MKNFARKNLFLSILSLLISQGLLQVSVVHADNSLQDKAEESMEKAKKTAKDTNENAKRDIKKHARKGKKHVRDATGNEDKVQDMKDEANNAADSVEAEANKATK